MNMISLIVPCFNEEENIIPFYNKVCETFEDYDGRVEIVFVDDGSSDHTYDMIRQVCADNRMHISSKGISFSRNFGKEAAMLAGLKSADGDYISFIDADLQQDPDYVRQMAGILDEDPDTDIVAACQARRHEGGVQIFLKNCFYRIINRLSRVHFENNVSDFRTFRRSVRNAMLSLTETERFSKGIFAWVGFKTRYIEYEVKDREHGTSHWSIPKLFGYAMDGIESFSDTGLKIAYPVSGIFFLVSVICLLLGHVLPGLVILAVSAQMFLTGVLGDYIGRTYAEVKHRPSYIIRKKCGRRSERYDILRTATGKNNKETA